MKQPGAGSAGNKIAKAVKEWFCIFGEDQKTVARVTI